MQRRPAPTDLSIVHTGEFANIFGKCQRREHKPSASRSLDGFPRSGALPLGAIGFANMGRIVLFKGEGRVLSLGLQSPDHH
jgi:hypothetical protein